jgi:hypothetical protein
MKQLSCAYCGKLVAKPEKEDVFPRCLYPSSKNKSKVQRLKVPACSDCNRSWSDDEAHFRNMLVIAGEKPNTVRQELFGTTMARSFKHIDGPRRIQDLIAEMKPVTIANSESYMVFPANDQRVIHIIKKIIRGLCYYHKIISPLTDQLIWADVLKDKIPQEFLDQMSYSHRERDIVQYKWQVLNEEGINSIWIITFFEKVTFIGIVASENNTWLIK